MTEYGQHLSNLMKSPEVIGIISRSLNKKMSNTKRKQDKL